MAEKPEEPLSWRYMASWRFNVDRVLNFGGIIFRLFEKNTRRHNPYDFPPGLVRWQFKFSRLKLKDEQHLTSRLADLNTKYFKARNELQLVYKSAR